MKSRTSVHLAKNVKGPLYFHVLGVPSGQFLRIAKDRDWTVYHFPEWQNPVAMVWDKPGDERLFMTHMTEGVLTHREVSQRIAEGMVSDWSVHDHEYGGLMVPHIVHEKFVLVPEECQVDEEDEHPILTIEPPCFLWLDTNTAHKAEIAAVAIIR